MWSAGETDKKASDIQARLFMARTLGEIGKRMPSWRRGKSGYMKSQNSIMHENYEEFISLTLRTRHSKRPSRTLARNWKHQWLPLCLSKMSKNNQHAVTSDKSDEIKSKLACILEASESARLRVGESLPKHHEDHIALYRVTVHCSITIWFTNLFLCLKPWNPCSKGSSGQGMGKISAWNLTKVRKKKEVIDEAMTSGAKVHFASLMDICCLKNAELEAKHQKYKGRVVLRGVLWKTIRGRFGVLCSIHWTRIISITNDSSENHGYHLKIAWLRRTSIGCSISFYPSENGRCS